GRHGLRKALPSPLVNLDSTTLLCDFRVLNKWHEAAAHTDHDSEKPLAAGPAAPDGGHAAVAESGLLGVGDLLKSWCFGYFIRRPPSPPQSPSSKSASSMGLPVSTVGSMLPSLLKSSAEVLCESTSASMSAASAIMLPLRPPTPLQHLLCVAVQAGHGGRAGPAEAAEAVSLGQQAARQPDGFAGGANERLCASSEERTEEKCKHREKPSRSEASCAGFSHSPELRLSRSAFIAEFVAVSAKQTRAFWSARVYLIQKLESKQHSNIEHGRAGRSNQVAEAGLLLQRDRLLPAAVHQLLLGGAGGQAVAVLAYLFYVAAVIMVSAYVFVDEAKQLPVLVAFLIAALIAGILVLVQVFLDRRSHYNTTKGFLSGSSAIAAGVMAILAAWRAVHLNCAVPGRRRTHGRPREQIVVDVSPHGRKKGT
uniref:Transmembrane protein n=1 Tax=Macrostomum lignano TaxID=282301 RepID=A0A1I8F9P6_9PLAT